MNSRATRVPVRMTKIQQKQVMRVYYLCYTVGCVSTRGAKQAMDPVCEMIYLLVDRLVHLFQELDARSRRYEVRRYSAVSLMTPFFIFKECASIECRCKRDGVTRDTTTIAKSKRRCHHNNEQHQQLYM